MKLDPFYWLDLYDKNGKPDHGKVMGVLAFLIFVGLALVERFPSDAATAMLLTCVFGSRAWMAKLKSNAPASPS